ncbi:MAG: agmatine deiminase family protein [Bacteroidales bacterium]|nr:agmatine deiminase family protein [Bacteroidales bacterium]
MKKTFILFATLALAAVMTVQAQDRKPDWARWHYLSEEEMNTPVRNENFVETDPPTGTPRFVGEFEPMQGVMIRYPLGIPVNLVTLLAENCHVYCITQQQGSAQSAFQNAGVNMNNVTFVNAPTDSYWVRDYGPWYIFEDRSPAIVDNRYNRPRPNDDNMSQVFANFWNIPLYGMNLEHTGGNMMEDGRGHGVSDELVFQENNNNEENVRQKMRDYLGIDPYHVTIDPQGDYIAHVDCWGKYLAPDKILIAQLPSSNSHAADYNAVADYFANTNCCWGYPYQVYRVQEPGGYTLAPYTNSLILNKSVYVPMGENATYNQSAIEVYQEAMPGYNIVPVYNNDYYISWENTDALHCRTRGVMDFNMLFVDHREVLHGEQEWQSQYPVVSKFIAYSGQDLKQDSLLVYYSIDGGTYQTAHMTATGNPDEYVGYITGFQGGSEIDYYVFGADESGHRYTQPVFAELDPHHFTVGPHAPSGELVITPDTLWFDQMGQNRSFNIINETTGEVTINSITPEAGSALNVWAPELPYTLPAGESVTVDINLQTPPTKDEYLAYEIEINTTAGMKSVVAMVVSPAYDMGLWIPGSPYVELTVNQPYAEAYVVNGNYGTHTPIEITAIYEENNTTGPILAMAHDDLPFTLEAGESFTIHLEPLGVIFKGEMLNTVVVIESDGGNQQFMVAVDEDLVSVSEIPAETKLYPNPTSGNFTVEGLNVAKVEVYNLVGQKVYEAEGKQVTIEAANWNKGIYLVNITYRNSAVETRKLVVR